MGANVLYLTFSPFLYICNVLNVTASNSPTSAIPEPLGLIQLKLTKVATPLMHSRSRTFGIPSQRPAKPNCPRSCWELQLIAATIRDTTTQHAPNRNLVTILLSFKSYMYLRFITI